MKAECSNCAGKRNVTVLAEHEDEWHDEDVFVSGINTYRILKCLGCDYVFYQTDQVNSENVVDTGPDEGELLHRLTYWPPLNKRSRPNWLNTYKISDYTLYDLLSSVYIALDNGLDILAAIGLRTAFDRASELLGIDAGLRFYQKLDALGSVDIHNE